MPHLLTLLGPSAGAALRRGAVKANLVHHLAHAGGAAVLRRIGRGCAPPRDWLPASGRAASPALARAFDRALAVPTAELRRGHPALRALDAFAAKGEFWARVGLAFNLLRVWDGGAAFREALAQLERALELEPDWAWGFLLRGEIRRSLIDYRGGAEDLRRAAALDPSWSWAPGFLSRALFQSGTDEDGLAPLDESIRLDPQAGFLRCWRGEAYRRLGRLDEAEREFAEGLRLDPSYDQGYGWRARLLDAQGRHAEAAASLRRGIALCPLFEKARRQLVRSLRGAGRINEAVRELEKAVALNHRNNWLGVWRAEGHEDGAEARRALAELDAVLRRRPKDAVALAWKGETLGQIGRLSDSLQTLDLSLRSRRQPRPLAWRGETLLRLGRLAEARQDLEASVRLDPSYGRAWAWLGRLRLLSRDFKGAESALTRALSERRVEYAWISAWRGEARLNLGRAKDALEDLDAAVALDEGHGGFRLLRAKARAALGDAAGAREDLETARRRPARALEPAEAPLWAELPWREILSGRGLARHARKAPWLWLLRYRRTLDHRDVDRAFRGDPECAWLAGLSELPARAPLQARLLRESWRGFASEPASAPLHAYRGQALLRAGDKSGGLRALEKAAGLQPAGWILAWLGEALRAAGRSAEARAAFDRAIALDPRYDNAWAWRGTLRLAEGDARGAVADLEKALSMRKTARAWHDLSRAWRALGESSEAVDAMEKAALLNPELGWGGMKPADGFEGDDARLATWKGENLIRLGRFEEAERVLAGAPETAWTAAFRAKAGLELRGLDDGVRKDVKKALRLDWAVSHALAAEAAFRDGNRARVRAHADRAVRLAPYSASIRLLRARARDWLRVRGADADRDAIARLLPGRRIERDGVVTSLLAASPGASAPSLEFFLNYSCNAKCGFCFNPPDASPELEKGLPLRELAARLLAGWKEGYRAVKFIGGEATVRDDLPRILGLARRIGFRSIQLTTNGIRLADAAYARRLVSLGVDRVRFSVHGHTPELHDRLVKVPGALEKLERAARTLRGLGVSLGTNYVLNRVNASAFPQTLDWLHRSLGMEDVIVYFLRYQGFAELPENRAELALRFSEAAGPLRAGFARLAALGAPWRPQLIHFAPCVAPELAAHMLDWTKDPVGSGEGNHARDRVTLPDGSAAAIHEVTNRGKRPVAACASCGLRERCLGIESNYVAAFGESEFRPLPAEARA